MNTFLDHPLPYRLNRPFFTFFRRYSVALLPLTALLGLLGGAVLFLTALLTGFLVWLAFGFCVLMARHSITIYDDRLVFDLSGKQYTAFHRDLRWVDVELTTNYNAMYYLLWIAWKGLGDPPLYVRFDLFGRKDRRILLRTIALFAPHAALNDLAKELAAGR